MVRLLTNEKSFIIRRTIFLSINYCMEIQERYRSLTDIKFRVCH